MNIPSDSVFDPLIAPYVNTLLANGIETFESCEGGEGHAFEVPTIRFHGNSGAGWKALSVALDNGFPVASIGQYWSIEDSRPMGAYWEMVLVKNKLGAAG